ncbi:caspase family protein [Lignipirellula cremea]|uniref:WD domain, G-beta repeat n=1 Tax=Lignipirellula cremea TaxID=2528010 RepID=A0A518DU75_9BACT|nr:caspase family protein [Lignipirellula cremea]QDU95385.1 WD domain, G-beta repeat [Lignipirellula cremea]
MHRWTKIQILGVLGCLASLSWGSLQASGQEGPPRLVLNPQGPLGIVNGMAFAPGSNRLYEGGDDKAVREWSVRDQDGRLSLAMQRTYRWGIARGQRGVVHTLAISGNGRYLAFSGLSAMSSNGDIALYDLRTGEYMRALRGHRQPLEDLSFSPDSKQLVSSSIDGELRVWQLSDFTDVVLREKSNQTLYHSPALFLSNDLVAAVCWDSPQQISIFDTSRPKARPYTLPHRHAGAVQVLARDVSGHWASADSKAEVYVWNGWKQSRVRAQERPALSLAFSPGGVLFMTTESGPQSKFSVMEMWDWRSGKLLDDRTISHDLHSAACAASTTGDYAAAYGSDQSEILLFRLRDAKGNRINKPLSSMAPTRRTGGGNKIWKVAFSTDRDYQLGIGVKYNAATPQFNRYGEITQYFDFKRQQMNAARRDQKWLDPETSRDGWKLSVDRTRLVLTLSQDGVTRGTIQMRPDAAQQGFIESYAWVNDAAGRTFALAVGTPEPNSGIYVYSLPTPRQPAKVLRYFRDHTDRVTSLSVSPDGKYLASGSTDQMIKLWSLEGLAPGHNAAGLSPTLGVRFALDNGKATVVAISKAGIAYARGLREGDTIESFRFLENGKVTTATKADDILAALQRRADIYWEDMVLVYRSKGQRDLKQLLLKPAWEPILNLFADRRGEWACWTPQGYYYQASVSGDELFGWQFNESGDQGPRFFQAAQFRKQLEQPQLIQRLLAAGNVIDALANSGVADPGKAAEYVLSLSTEAPQVTLVSPRPNTKFGRSEEILIEAEVKVIDPRDADRFVAACRINGAPLGAPAVARRGVTSIYQWKAVASSSLNRIRVSVEERGLHTSGFFQDVDVFVQAEPIPVQPKLHIVTLAANDYPGKLALTYPLADAAAVVKALALEGGELYQPGEVMALVNDEITPDSVTDLISELQNNLKNVAAEDVLVVFIAGHGVSDTDDYFFIPPFSTGEDLGSIRLQEKGISWQLLRKIMSIRCRKLFLLDTCFSGNIIRNERDPAYQWKAAVRPLRRDEAVVITATSPGQFSYEPSPAKADEMGIHNGLFTHSIVMGLAGHADGESSNREGRNDRIEVDELVHFVRKETNRLSPLQQPTSTPVDDLGFVPLTEFQRRPGE